MERAALAGGSRHALDAAACPQRAESATIAAFCGSSARLQRRLLRPRWLMRGPRTGPRGIVDMDRFKRIFPALALCLLPFSYSEARQAQPCEDSMLQSLSAQLGRSGWSSPSENAQGPLVAAACKPWPDDPNLSVVTLAYRDAKDSSSPGDRNLNWLVAKVDTHSGQLRERYDDYLGEDSALELDAGSLWIRRAIVSPLACARSA